ncbi:MAG: hypothetical protein Q9191_005384 [Dirinaria sp. TL-2023a]
MVLDPRYSQAYTMILLFVAKLANGNQRSSKLMLITVKEGLSGQIDLKEDDPDMIDNMLYFLYTSDYQDDADGGRPLLVNAKMYAVGDKYDIPALKTLAKDKFAAGLGPNWDIATFLEVLETAYTNTPASDRGLRDCLAPVLLEHKNELHEHEGFAGLIKNNLGDGEFAMDVINIWTKPVSTRFAFGRKNAS